MSAQMELPGAWDEWAAGAGLTAGWMSAPIRLGPKRLRQPAPFAIIHLLPAGAGVQVDIRASDNTVWWTGQAFSGDRLPVLLAALEDAAEWRELLAGEWAAKRGEYLAQAAAYRDLSHLLGQEHAT